jgi:hypothetical protein
MTSRIRLPSALLLYEVCRVQKLASEDLGKSKLSNSKTAVRETSAYVNPCWSSSLIPSTELFTEEFIDHLFELVERTRLLYDETLNYALIKLLVRLVFPHCTSLPATLTQDLLA